MKTYKKPKKVVINRKKWLRGCGTSASSLLDGKTGKMCCLGFWCLQAGIPRKQIKDVSSPADLINKGVSSVSGLSYESKNITGFTCGLTQNNTTCIKMMQTNDDKYIDDEERERTLKRLAKKNLNVTLEFIDK